MAVELAKELGSVSKPKRPEKLMVRVKEMMETRHYVVSTQKTYRYWILDYIRYPASPVSFQGACAHAVFL